MDAGGSDANVYFADCQSGNANQIFYYEASTLRIKNGGKCVDYNLGNNDNNVYMHGEILVSCLTHVF